MKPITAAYKLITHPINTIKALCVYEYSTKQLLKNIFFLTCVCFLLISFESPGKYHLFVSKIFVNPNLNMITDNILWSLDISISLTAILSLSLWVNCLGNKTKLNFIRCAVITTFILIPCVICGLLIGDLLTYFSQHTSRSLIFFIINRLFACDLYLISNGINVFMFFGVVMLAVAGALLSGVSIKKNIEKYLLGWTVISVLAAFIFNS